MDNCHIDWADVSCGEETKHSAVQQAFTPLPFLLHSYQDFSDSLITIQNFPIKAIRSTECFRVAKTSLVRHIRGFSGVGSLIVFGGLGSRAAKSFCLGGAAACTWRGLFFQLTGI